MCYFTIIVFNGTIECMSNVITLKLTNAQEAKLYEAWSENAKTPPQYAKWQLKCENCVITCYTSGKTVFQGKEANVYASPFMEEELMQPKLTVKDILPQAGSDEVGTGDYFGPVVVCAAIVDKNTDALLHSLGVRDSKQLKDEDILNIAPEIIAKVPHSLLIVDNRKYNAVHETNNLNAIKAKLHNQAYVKSLISSPQKEAITVIFKMNRWSFETFTLKQKQKINILRLDVHLLLHAMHS